MDKRAVLGGVAVLAAVDVALWLAVFQRSTPPAASSSGSEAAETSRVATASPEPSASTASAAPPSEPPSEPASEPASETPSASPSESPSASPSGSAGSEPPDEQPRVEVTSGAVSGAAYETVPISGVLRGAQDPTTLRVQYQEGGRWTSFPLPTTTDAEGRFTAYVEMGAPGTYPLRVLDPRTGTTSPAVLLTVS